MKRHAGLSNETLARLLARGLRAADLPETQLTGLFERVLARIEDASAALTETVRGASVPWLPLTAGVWTKVLKSDAAAGMQTALFRLEPGSVFAAHSHRMDEECLVLQGEIFLGTHRVGEGDFHIARAGSAHPDLTTSSGALLLVRSEIPVSSANGEPSARRDGPR